MEYSHIHNLRVTGLAYSANRTQLGNLTYAYDADGRRTAAGGSLAAVTLPSNVTANLLTGLGIDEYFTRTDAGGTMAFLADALGSTVGLVNAVGGIDTGYTYQPFGAVTVNGTSANPYQFTGRENDGAGLYFYRARYYSPTFQRFVSQDPRITARTLNPYTYSLDDPNDFTDPLGLFPIPWGLPINIMFGGGTCGLIGGVIGGAAGGILTDNPFGAMAGAAIFNSIGQAICNDPCAGALNCNEDQMLPPTPPPASGPTCSEQHP